MKVDPGGRLAEILKANGLSRCLSGFDVDDGRLHRFRRDFYRQPHLDEEEKEALSIYAAITHPGWVGGGTSKEIRLADEVLPKARVEAGELPKEIFGEPELTLPDSISRQETDWEAALLWLWRMVVILLLSGILYRMP